MKTSTVLIIAGVGVAVYLFARQQRQVVVVPTSPTDPLRAAGGELLTNAGNAIIGAIFGSKKEPTPSTSTESSAALAGGDTSGSPPILDYGRWEL